MENDKRGKTGPLDKGFLEQETLEGIKQLKANKSYFGVICNEMLKCNPKAISRVLCKLFNCILKAKISPEKWNLSFIKPLHKSGTMSKHDNYRGICISNHLSKLFTSLLDKRLQLWANSNNVLPDNSVGFRKGVRRTEDGLFIFTSLLDKYAKKRKKVYACFVDFTKFYNTVSDDLLFIKLLEKGITDIFSSLIKNIYANYKYAVKVRLPTYEDSDTSIISKANYHTRYRWVRTTFIRSIAGL